MISDLELVLSRIRTVNEDIEDDDDFVPVPDTHIQLAFQFICGAYALLGFIPRCTPAGDYDGSLTLYFNHHARHIHVDIAAKSLPRIFWMEDDQYGSEHNATIERFVYWLQWYGGNA